MSWVRVRMLKDFDRTLSGGDTVRHEAGSAYHVKEATALAMARVGAAVLEEGTASFRAEFNDAANTAAGSPGAP